MKRLTELFSKNVLDLHFPYININTNYPLEFSKGITHCAYDFEPYCHFVKFKLIQHIMIQNLTRLYYFYKQNWIRLKWLVKLNRKYVLENQSKNTSFLKGSMIIIDTVVLINKTMSNLINYQLFIENTLLN